MLPRAAKPTTQRTNIVIPLEIQIQKNIGDQSTGAVTLKLTGSLDTGTAPDLEGQLAPVLGGQVKDIVFDLAQLFRASVP